MARFCPTFVRFSAEMAGIMIGCIGPSKEQLANLRQAIIQDGGAFRSLLQAPELVEKFGEIQGEKNKRIPKELQEAAEKEPLILNKQFYFMTSLPAHIILQEDLIEVMMSYWHAARPMNEFLTNHL